MSEWVPMIGFVVVSYHAHTGDETRALSRGISLVGARTCSCLSLMQVQASICEWIRGVTVPGNWNLLAVCKGEQLSTEIEGAWVFHFVLPIDAFLCTRDCRQVPRRSSRRQVVATTCGLGVR